MGTPSDSLLEALRLEALRRDNARRTKAMKTPYHFVTKTCPFCKWPFQCSTEQMERLCCAACARKR